MSFYDGPLYTLYRFSVEWKAIKERKINFNLKVKQKNENLSKIELDIFISLPIGNRYLFLSELLFVNGI